MVLGTVPGILWFGGRIGFPTYHGSGLDLFRDLREVRPTFIYSVPRFFETIHSLFNETVRNFGGNKEARKRAIELFRSDKGPLGDRCCSLSIGSAPVTPAVFQFMEDVWSEDNGGTAYVSRGLDRPNVVRLP